jgi:cysteinyl-tRNA synthetase
MLLNILAAGLLVGLFQGKQPGAGPIHLADGKTVKVQDFAIQLKSLDLTKLQASVNDLLVIDPFEGKKPLSKAQVESLKKGPRGRRLVLAYVPIAEINQRSPLWKAKWDADSDGRPDAGAPDWLESRNADGDYPVRYWTPDWQKTLFAGKSTILSSLMKTGYDGMVMHGGEAIETKELPTFRATQELGKLMVLMTQQARRTRRTFLSLCMNPEELMEFGGVILSLDGVLVDGLFYGNEAESKPSTEAFLKEYEELEELAEERRLVLAVAYTTDPALKADNDRRARAKGFIPFATTKGLDKLPMNH